MLCKTPDRMDLLDTMITTLGRAVPVGQSYYDDTYLPDEVPQQPAGGPLVHAADHVLSAASITGRRSSATSMSCWPDTTWPGRCT